MAETQARSSGFGDRKKFVEMTHSALNRAAHREGPKFTVAAALFFAWRAADHLSVELRTTDRSSLEPAGSLMQFQPLIEGKAPMLVEVLSQYRKEVYRTYKRTNRNFTLDLARNFIIDRRGECIYPFCRNTP